MKDPLQLATASSINSHGENISPEAGTTAAARTPTAADGSGGLASPRQVIRGESYLGQDPETGERALIVPTGRKGECRLIPLPEGSAPSKGAFTDWLNLTFPMAPFRSSLGELFQLIFTALGRQFAPAINRQRGLHGYDCSYALGETGAFFAHGGNADTGFISISGDACALISDWSHVVNLGRDKLKGRPTRWDGTRDEFLGSHSVDDALNLYRADLFGVGGRKPTMNMHGNWDTPDGRGRTIEIGLRKNGKMLRVYEKGMAFGLPFHPWVRWELELHNTGRVIPWDVLESPGQYLVGAFPKALAWMQNESRRIDTLQKQTQISYDVLTAYTSKQYGRHIDLMLKVEGSPEKVVEKLRRPGVPRRLRHPAIESPAELLKDV